MARDVPRKASRTVPDCRVAVLIAVFVLVSVTVLSEPARAGHSGDVYDCDDFATRADLQRHVNDHRGDQDNLDPDNDGLACEEEFSPGVPIPGSTSTSSSTTSSSTTSTSVRPTTTSSSSTTSSTSTSTSTTTSSTSTTRRPAATTSPAQVTPDSVTPGGSVTVTGSGFAPNSSFSVTFAETPAVVPNATATASGTYSFSLTVPSGTAPGSRRIVATGQNPQGGQHQSTGAVTVVQTTPTTTTTTTGLPRTGPPRPYTGPLAGIGVLLFLIGWWLYERASWSAPVSSSDWRR